MKAPQAKALGYTAVLIVCGIVAGSILGADRGGSEGGKPFAPEVLQGFVPAQLGGMERTAIEARADTAMDMDFSSVTAEFRNDAGRVEVRVQDIGAVSALALAMGAWAQNTVSRDTQDEVEKVYQRDGVSIKEQFRKDGSQAEMSLLLGNGVMLDVSGDSVSMDTVRSAMAALDVKGLAALQRAK